jgi:hypothetical protein
MPALTELTLFWVYNSLRRYQTFFVKRMITMQAVSFSNSALGVIACGLFAAILAMPSMAAVTDADVEALAKKSQNPVAKMISVPFEYNFNGEFGPNNGKQHVLNIKPVLPSCPSRVFPVVPTARTAWEIRPTRALFRQQTQAR